MVNYFDLTDKVALVTGAGGLLGPKHAEALLEFGASVILTDVDLNSLIKKFNYLSEKFGKEKVFYQYMDVVDKKSINDVISKMPQVKTDGYIFNQLKEPFKDIYDFCADRCVEFCDNELITFDTFQSLTS